MDESGPGFLISSGMQASYLSFAAILPPIPHKVSTWSSVYSSSFTEKTCIMLLNELRTSNCKINVREKEDNTTANQI